MSRSISRKKLQLAPSFSLDLGMLESFVRGLNAEFTYSHMGKGEKATRNDMREFRTELRRLTKAWFDSGPNVRRLFDLEPALGRSADNVRAELLPTRIGYAQLRVKAKALGKSQDDPKSVALGLFFSFLANPWNSKLAGPCKDCDSYYLKRTERQNVYCSLICGRRNTSRQANQTRAWKERSRRIRRAQKALMNWCKGNKKRDWKKYVCGEALVSKNFLTRALASGELTMQ
jgi:hypothetical protein